MGVRAVGMKLGLILAGVVLAGQAGCSAEQETTAGTTTIITSGSAGGTTTGAGGDGLGGNGQGGAGLDAGGSAPAGLLLPGFHESALSCGNGVQDGHEDGLDCGGACPACPPPPGSAVIYISESLGNDDWSGTLPDPNPGMTDGPWRTLQKLNSSWTAVLPGHFILLRRGDRWAPSSLTTSGIIQLPVDKAGAEGIPITVGAYGSGALPILSTSSLSGPSAIHSTGLSYFNFEDLELRGTVAFVSTTASGVHHVRFRRIVWDGEAAGDSAGGNISFFTPPFVENAPESWSINPLHHVEFGFCLLQNNGSNDILNFNTPTGAIWIHHNEFYNSLREALDFGGGDDLTIEYNIISGGREANGVKIQPQAHTIDNLIVRGNLIVHVGTAPYHYPLVVFNARNAQIYNNTLVSNNLESSGGSAAIFGWLPSAPVYLSGQGTWGFDGNQIHDNIFVGWVTFGVAEGVVITYQDGSSITYDQDEIWEDNSFQDDYYYNPKDGLALQTIHYVPPTAVWYDPNVPGFYANDQHTTSETIAPADFATQWLAHPNVSGEAYGDPWFVDPTWTSPSDFGDFRLQPGSPAGGRGCYPE